MEIPFPKLRNNSFVKDPEKHKYPTGQHPGRFWNPCRTHFLGLETRTCARKRGRLVTLLCTQCYPVLQTKGDTTSNLAKHLKDRHPDLFKEFKESYQSDSLKSCSKAIGCFLVA